MGKAILPYKTLETLNSWGLTFYCLPEQDDSKILIPIDIKKFSQKCGLKGKTLEDEISDEYLLIKKKLEKGGPIMKFNINEMHGNINNNETHGNNSPIILSDSNTDSELIKAISELEDNISQAGNEVDELRNLLKELKENSLDKKPSIKKRLSDWMSQSANIITIGSALYTNKQSIIDGVQYILSML